jgi:hypothetical protein
VSSAEEIIAEARESERQIEAIIRNDARFADSKIFHFIEGALAFSESGHVFMVSIGLKSRVFDIKDIKSISYLSEGTGRFYCVMDIDDFWTKVGFLDFDEDSAVKTFGEIENLYNKLREKK